MCKSLLQMQIISDKMVVVHVTPLDETRHVLPAMWPHSAWFGEPAARLIDAVRAPVDPCAHPTARPRP